MLKFITALATTAMLCTGALAGSYGAIAYSPDTGAVGYATKANSRGQAQSQAMGYCDQYAYDCRVVVNFVRACGAVAQGDNGGWGSDWGYDRYEAQQDALASCSNHDDGCRVLRWACTAR